MAQNRIKVDITALTAKPSSLHGDFWYLCVLNFTIPLVVAQTNPQPVLQHIADYIFENFEGKNPVYSLNASFKLIKTSNGDIRIFTGSFYPNALSEMTLTGDEFIKFRFATFLPELTPLMTEEHARQKLTRVVSDETDWTFDSVVSFIISVQVMLPGNHQFIRAHDLVGVRRGRKRRQITLYQF